MSCPYTEEIKTYVHTEACLQMFPAALGVIRSSSPPTAFIRRGHFQDPSGCLQLGMYPSPHTLLFPVWTYLWSSLIYERDTVRDYPNCQHRYSCALGPLLSTVRATWAQALGSQDRQSDNQDGCQLAHGHNMLGWTSQDFTTLLRIAHGLKLTHC